MSVIMTTEDIRSSFEEAILAIVMVGPSGSGKSTAARAIATEADAIVSTDRIREMLTGDASNQKVSGKAFKIANMLWETRIAYGQSTVFDATSTRSRDRKRLTGMAREANPNAMLIAIVMETEPELCKARNQMRDRVVPDHVIDRQVEAFQANLDNLKDEDFDLVFFYSETGSHVGFAPQP